MNKIDTSQYDDKKGRVSIKFNISITWKMLLAGTDKKSLMPSPKLLAKPIGLPITPAEPNTCKINN